MRIRRYAARLLSSTSPGSAATAAPSSPPRPPAASWLHTDDDDCCAFCELSRPASQEGLDAIKHKGYIADRVLESVVRADERVGLPERPPVPEVKKCKIDHVPPVNKACVGLQVVKLAAKPEGAAPASEDAADPATKAGVFVVNDAAIEQGVKCIASLSGGASKMEVTVENSLANGPTTELEVSNSLANGPTTELGVSKGTSLANESADLPGVTCIMPEVTDKPVTDLGVISTVVEVSDTGPVVHETTELESAGEDYIASEATAEPEDAGRASCNVDDTAALDEPQPPNCDLYLGNVQDGNAIDTVTSTLQPSRCDAAEGGGSVNFTTNIPVRARGPTFKGGVLKDKSVAPSVLLVLDVLTRSIGKSGRTDVICYARRTGKRKAELLKVKKENIDLEDGVICEKEETLVSTDRCECVLSTAGSIDVKLADIKKDLMDNSAVGKVKKMKRNRFECNIDYCHMVFKTEAELAVHKKNMCTVSSCSRHFRSHRYLRRHQSAHNDDMPYKCPWDGCNMAFKWSWDRAEHFKVHAGAKPYKCTTPGCSKIFKFVSDFTRHRRRCKPQR
ncbi:Lysine-specific demethylase SE14 [Zea mays]|nr:Krueppel-like factor 12 isoform X2 [Zea mays]ONL93673.1 Metal regulatory transcription factor 1 [Zea mays]PWZ56407.1 Lysine-specific demethylase SE14 [Zea mays]|eukprot:XP_008651091.1 Krueppel-like factor 12 isoform X2 [Zea mays]